MDLHLGPKIETLYRAGFKALACRSLRRFRTRAIYPRLGPRLFPLSSDAPNQPEGDKILDIPPSAFSFFPGEKAASHPAPHLTCEHIFSFLNLPPQDLGTPVNWRHLPRGDRLWQTCLHSGGWAEDLAEAYLLSGEERFRDSLIGLMGDWIEHNPVGQEPGWEPYSVSRRLIAWAKTAGAMGHDARWQAFWRERLRPSLRQQAQFLASNLERDLANNHLLANFLALSWMGLLFPAWPQASRWKEIGLQGLWGEMRRQVLPDGVHDERSLAYHAQVLQDIREGRRACLSSGEPVPEDAAPTIEKMVRFLVQMRAPDGTYPQWNDSVFDSPADRVGVPPGDYPAAGEEERFLHILQGEGACAEDGGGIFPGRPPVPGGGEKRPSLSVFPHSGFCVLRPGADHFLYFDAGPMGPDHLPGHGHADALSFLLFAGGKWLITDPGVFSYHDREWRDHFRSTSAHNTVTVDGRDQCIFWGPFRVAHPPAARMIDWGEGRVAGEHEGYARLQQPVIHRRWLRSRGGGEWEIVDSFSGRGEHEFAFTLQLAPGGAGEVSGPNAQIRWPGGAGLGIFCPSPPPGAAAVLERGWVSRAWYTKERAPRYVLRWKGRVPAENRVILKIQARFA